MAWTYQFDEIDKEVTKDQSTPGRFTFNRYLYFKPDQYEGWSKQQGYSEIPYTAELVGNPAIPSAGTPLSGSLSGFYLKDIMSITNLTTEEHGDHCSYAQVTLEYENISTDTQGNDSAPISYQPSKGLKPWQRKVEDFQITNQSIEVPMIQGWTIEMSGGTPVEVLKDLKTTAGQPLYGQTSQRWVQRLTWTYFSKDEDYSMSGGPIVNISGVTIFDKITIPEGKGLLMPPSYRKLYYYKNSDDTHPDTYDQWNFEIIVDDTGFFKEFLNAGTKAIISGVPTDICSWYIYTPDIEGRPPVKAFGSFDEMMYFKKQVDEHNKSVSEEANQWVFTGDFVQSPVPLTLSGTIDMSAVYNASETVKRKFRPYEKGIWHLGIR